MNLKRPCCQHLSSPLFQVTGKTKVEYFFDPTLVLPPDASSDAFDLLSTPAKTPLKRAPSVLAGSDNDDALFTSKHLFMPCTVVKELDAEDGQNEDAVPALVKTADGQLHKIRVRGNRNCS